MADDIDDLLNEADEYLDGSKTGIDMHNNFSKTKSYPATRAPTSGKFTFNSRRKSDVECMIDDILDDSSPSNNSSTKPAEHNVLRKTSSVPTKSSGQSKCFQVWLGGSTETGLSTAVYQRCCNSLHCTDCDFRIAMFENHQWHSSTDYLFLRNNMPDYQRLKSKLRSKNGFRAYACQCKWKTIKDLTCADSLKDIKWVCRKH